MMARKGGLGRHDGLKDRGPHQRQNDANDSHDHGKHNANHRATKGLWRLMLPWGEWNGWHKAKHRAEAYRVKGTFVSIGSKVRKPSCQLLQPGVQKFRHRNYARLLGSLL